MEERFLSDVLDASYPESLMSEPTLRVTAVCLGNICRSPIAEVVLSDRVARAGLGARIQVDSAGTGDWHVGGRADHRTIAVLTSHGYDIDHVPRQITHSWMENIDLLLAMDHRNYRDLDGLIRGGSTQVRPTLRMLRSFDPQLLEIAEPDTRLDVPDPYYGDPADFEDVLAMVERAADGVVTYLEQRLSGA